MVVVGRTSPPGDVLARRRHIARSTAAILSSGILRLAPSVQCRWPFFLALASLRTQSTRIGCGSMGCRQRASESAPSASATRNLRNPLLSRAWRCLHLVGHGACCRSLHGAPVAFLLATIGALRCRGWAWGRGRQQLMWLRIIGRSMRWVGPRLCHKCIVWPVCCSRGQSCSSANRSAASRCVRVAWSRFSRPWPHRSRRPPGAAAQP